MKIAKGVFKFVIIIGCLYPYLSYINCMLNKVNKYDKNI